MAKEIVLQKVDDLHYTDPNEDLEQAISDYLARENGEAVSFSYVDNGESVRVIMNTKEMTCYEYLLAYEYFTEEELKIALCFGDNNKTYDTICYGRYGMDIDQLALEDSKGGETIVLTDYPNQIGI